MRIGIIGAGMIGGTLADLWAEAGHETCKSSRHPEKLSPAAGGTVGTVEEAAAFGEVVLLAVPFGATAKLSAQVRRTLEGKVVLDAGNPFPRRDGSIVDEVAKSRTGSGAWTQSHLPGAKVVKAFNTVYFEKMKTSGKDGKAPVGVPLAGDDAGALATAAQLVRDAGMDPVEIGPLKTAAQFDPGTPLWNSKATALEIRDALVGGGEAP